MSSLDRSRADPYKALAGGCVLIVTRYIDKAIYFHIVQHLLLGLKRRIGTSQATRVGRESSTQTDQRVATATTDCIRDGIHAKATVHQVAREVAHGYGKHITRPHDAVPDAGTTGGLLSTRQSHRGTDRIPRFAQRIHRQADCGFAAIIGRPRNGTVKRRHGRWLS